MSKKQQKNDLFDAFEEIENKENGIMEEIEDTGNDLDEDINIKRGEKPSSSPKDLDRGLNADDLIDNIPEEDDDINPETLSDSEGSFAPSKSFNKKKKMMQGAAFITGALILLAIIIVPEFKKNRKVKEEEVLSETDKIIEEMKNYSAGDLKKKKERIPAEAVAEVPLNSTIDKKKTGGHYTGATGACSGPNCMKDKDILEKYASVNPADASEGGYPASKGLMNIPPCQGTKGGLNILGRSKEISSEKVKYYNLEVKAFLQFGVRSSGGSSVVAVLKESAGDFPEGSIFYGDASFNNKRTFIKFSHAIVNDEKMLLEGKAMQGKDPGIPSEVTEIAADNADSSLKAGVLGVAGKVADNALSRVTGGAAEGVLSDSTADLQEKQEKDKKQYEYFVPAKTIFTIYIY